MPIDVELRSNSLTKGHRSFDIESSQSGAWGEVHDHILDDAVTRGRYALETGGALYALQNWGAELQRIIDQKIWRSAAAFSLLAHIRREVFGPGVFTPSTPTPSHVLEVENAVV